MHERFPAEFDKLPPGNGHEAYILAADSLHLRSALKENATEQGKDEDRDIDETAQPNNLDERGPFLEERCAVVTDLDPSEYLYRVEVEANVLKERKTLESVLEIGKPLEENISLEGKTVDTMPVSDLQKAPGRKAASCTSEKQNSRLPLLKGVCAWRGSVVLLNEGQAAQTINELADRSLNPAALTLTSGTDRKQKC